MTTTRHLLDVDDLSTDELTSVLDRAAALEGATGGDELATRTLAMVFEKPSTRTRVSFETGLTQLGGHAIFLGPDDIGLDGREPLRDIARVLSGYADAVMLRLFDHADAATVAEHASVPVINGLTDDAHPCQTLADLLTIRESVGFDATVAWVGAGNNVARSFALGCALAGIDLRVATPDAYGLGETLLDRAAAVGRAPTVVDDPETAVAGADVVYTDVWVSMGEEDERAARLETFEAGGYRVDEALLDAAGTDPRVMHCLPANRGEEVTDAVLESDRALVWRQAENRMHAQKGLLVELLE